MAKHAKPKERFRDWPLTQRGERVFYSLAVATFFVVFAVLSALIERIG